MSLLLCVDTFLCLPHALSKETFVHRLSSQSGYFRSCSEAPALSLGPKQIHFIKMKGEGGWRREGGGGPGDEGGRERREGGGEGRGRRDGRRTSRERGERTSRRESILFKLL